MTRKQIMILGGVLLLALVLAFSLQDVIESTFVVPLAYLWWALGVFYSTLPQVVLWGGLVILALVLLLKSLISPKKRESFVKRKTRTRQGNVEVLAASLEKTRDGIYNKWKVANCLGRLARDLLIQRGDRENTKVIAPLVGRDWRPSEPVSDYLNVGLNGSFADYPSPRWPFSRPQPTPLDIDVEEVVEFLESQIQARSTTDKRG